MPGNQDLKKLERKFPRARKDTLNDMAFKTRSKAVSNINKDSTLRNNFTVKSVRVDKATESPTSYAETGSFVDYM
jgi:hypothetical protein